MANRVVSFSIEELPSHLILEVLTAGCLSAADLAALECSCRIFGGSYGVYPLKFRSMAEFAAYQLCRSHPLFGSLSVNAQTELFDRCGQNWKRALRFLQSVEHSSGVVETSAGNMQITTGRYHTLLIHNSEVYSCGSSICGALGHGSEETRCDAFSLIRFPSFSRVIHVSAAHNHAAFVMESGEVFTCGDNSSFCCGHGEVGRAIFRPTCVEALKGIPCKQVATGLSFTIFLSKKGDVYSCGSNAHGQLGHGDSVDRSTPKIVKAFENLASVVQIATGASYSLVVTNDGSVYSFGSGTNFCLGHGDQHNELSARAIQSFKRKNIHVVRVSAGDEHVVALDSNGYVYTWGKGYCGALGHGDEIDKTSPALLTKLQDKLAVQVCARKRKTFVLLDDGRVYAFGWMGFGSLGFSDRGTSDKITQPRILDGLRHHHIAQVNTGLYHTLAITKKGLIFGFGDNERAQLGHDTLRGCLEPTEIVLSTRERHTTETIDVNLT